MKLRLSCPSKTFLTGEYAAIDGGPALIINTHPRFELTLEKTGRSDYNIFHPDSPAGRWIRERAPLLEDWEMKFHDPHEGRGGFGASGAQFVLSHCATTFLQISADKVREGFDLKALWNDFQVLSRGASGYDVLSQMVGGVAHIEARRWIVQGLAWPFPDLQFLIVRTGRKTQTHRHLASLTPDQVRGLSAISADVCRAFEEADSDLFLTRSQEFSRVLIDRGLTVPSTLERLDELSRQLDLKLARGCGALGADTMLLVFEPSEREEIVGHLRAKGLEIIAENQDISTGLEVDWSWNKA